MPNLNMALVSITVAAAHVAVRYAGQDAEMFNEKMMRLARFGPGCRIQEDGMKAI